MLEIINSRMYKVIANAIIFVCICLSGYYSFCQSSPETEKDGSVLLPSQKNNSFSPILISTNTPNSSAWKNFYTNNGNWTVIWDNVTQTPLRAFGKPLNLNNFNKITADNVDIASKLFLKQYSNILNLNPDNLKFISAKLIRKLWYVNYRQNYSGLDVLLSNITLRITTDGKVAAFGIKYYNDININLKPRISITQAMEKSVTGLNFKKNSDIILNTGKLYILPVQFNNHISFNLVYEFQIETNEPVSDFVSYVDAHNGNLLWRFNRCQDMISKINSKGGIKQKYSFDSTVFENFYNQLLITNSQNYITDKDGNVNIDINDITRITSKLEGPWSKVLYSKNVRPMPELLDSVTPGSDLSFEWNDSNSTSIERNLFYHTNKIHKYITELDTNLTAMDFQVQVKISPEDKFSNAMSYKDTIIFFGTDNEEYKFAESPSVLYHEYTHTINSKLFKEILKDSIGMVNGACHEGTADIGSCFIIDDSLVGRGAYFLKHKYLRTVANKTVYPDSVWGESHHDGQILSGALWDIRRFTSLTVAEIIAHFAKYGTPDDPDNGIAFMEWFIECLIADDNHFDGDNDLSNGTPHLAEIIAGFNNHHIGTDLLMFFSYAHSPLNDTKDTVNPYMVEFNLKSNPNLLNSHPEKVEIFYSTDNFKTSNLAKAEKVSQEPDSTKYRAEIPPMKKGTIVQYYISASESVSKREFNFPETISKNYKPYEFLVGFDTLKYENFEIDSAWIVGNFNDDASTGIWEWAEPMELKKKFLGKYSIFQPGKDNMLNGSKCWVTGAQVIDSDNLRDWMANMPNGRTTLTSTNYNLSNVYKPFIKFNKWFTNEIIVYPPVKSRFALQVSNDGGTSWKTVDTSFVSTWEWTKSQFLIEDYIPPTDRVRIRFYVNARKIGSDYISAFTEALIDDFVILYAGKTKPNIVDDDIASNQFSVSCYPNPFNSGTKFQFDLSSTSKVYLTVFDLFGYEVFNFTEDYSTKGLKEIFWNGADKFGNKVNPGFYLYKLRTPDLTSIGKLIVW